MNHFGKSARETVWRIAVKFWLQSRGFIKVHIPQKVSPNFTLFFRNTLYLRRNTTRAVCLGRNFSREDWGTGRALTGGTGKELLENDVIRFAFRGI
jgi:hypothetical protein